MYRLRFIWIILVSFFTKPKKITEDFDLTFRVIPFIDTDFSRMFTHSYSTYMGLARWHYVFASELRAVAIKNKWAPVTTSETITYRRSIKAFSKVILKTKLLTWDEERFYLEHSFLVNGKEMAHCTLEGLIRAPQGIQKPGDVFTASGLQEDAPQFSEKLKEWISFLR